MTEDELYAVLTCVMPRQVVDALLAEELAEAKRREYVRELRRIARGIKGRRRMRRA
jgi:hypothetical protein